MAAFAKASLPTRSQRALRVIDPVRAKGFSQRLKPNYSLEGFSNTSAGTRVRLSRPRETAL